MTNEELRARRYVLWAELAEVSKQIQETCKHKWEWAQVAGEGKVCPRCGARDYDVDD